MRNFVLAMLMFSSITLFGIAGTVENRALGSALTLFAILLVAAAIDVLYSSKSEE